MRQILWFRRDLRIEDNAILSYAKNKVLPIFIFDKNILESLPKDDKRVTFIYKSVLSLKEQLKQKGLDLAIFYGEPKEVIGKLKDGFDEILCSCDFDDYAKNRDNQIEELLPMKRFYDSFITHPSEHLKNDGTPYKVFTPYYKSMAMLTQSNNIETYKFNETLKKIDFDYEKFPTLDEMGFKEVQLPEFLNKNVCRLMEDFSSKLEDYQESRDYFFKDGTSKLSVHLRFGIVSPRQLFNYYRKFDNSEGFIRELFWREFYNYILYHFPHSQYDNFNGMSIKWNENEDDFIKWCEGNTGVPIIDASMRHLNETGTMHNRLRMIVCSFLTKNLFINWKKGEEYFALKLLDYECSSNVGSWQWGASTGADAAPYFRVFNPYTQSQKFDKEGIFIKSVIKEFESLSPRLFHIENGVQSNLFVDYPKSIVDISLSRKMAIDRFKEAKNV